jgi:L-cystine uptake protein TcyP (sodium:dicarboxylate symporter family)
MSQALAINLFAIAGDSLNVNGSMTAGLLTCRLLGMPERDESQASSRDLSSDAARDMQQGEQV